MVDHELVEDLFQEALELAPERRQSFLARACGDDTDLRREVESLILADEQAGGFLARPFVGARSMEMDTTVDRGVFGRSASGRPRRLSRSEHLLTCSAVVAERYRVIRYLGRGGMAEVYHAEDLRLEEPVALKFLTERLSNDETIRSHFLSEVKLARRVSHPNVCRVFDVVEVDGHLFLTMELIDGEDLASWIARVGRPAREEASEVLRQVCRGLAAVHDQGILHRDLKPSNLMIDALGRVRITDFGIAGMTGTFSEREARQGTPAYMAPEQHTGGEVSVRTDLYALGLVMYELLVGRRVFEGEVDEYARLHCETRPASPASLGVRLEPAVEQILLRCLAKDPLERPSSARDVGAVLEPDAGLPEIRPLHQLPPPPADFTGREAELAELMKAVVSRGVTISGLQGMGGIGKTALALKLAEALAPSYPDAQIYLDLKGASPDPLTPTRAMAHVIHAFRPQAPLPPHEAGVAAVYRSVLHGQRVLLLMDNAAGPEQVEPLIPPSGCCLLVTSRTSFVLPGLVAKRLDCLPADDAVDLLKRIAPGAVSEAHDIARLCGYLPIALRLAGGALAERPDLTPAEYVRRLEEGTTRLELVEATLRLSYELLDTRRKRLWRALAVFPGAFAPSAAAAVWELTCFDAHKYLGELVKSGLVEWSDERYRLHDLVRIFAEHRWNVDEGLNHGRRYAEHYLEVLGTAEGLYLQGWENTANGLGLLDAEWIHIVRGQSWCEAHAERDPDVARLCSDYPKAGSNCLWLRLSLKDRIRWQERALQAARCLEDRIAQGFHLSRLGYALGQSGEPHRAIELCEQALAIAQDLGDRAGEAMCHHFLSHTYSSLGSLRRNIDCLEKALPLVREIGDRRAAAYNLGNMSGSLAMVGEPQRAIDLLRKAIRIVRETGDLRTEGMCLINLGFAYSLMGELRLAFEFTEDALAITREIGDRTAEGYCLDNLSSWYVEVTEYQRAFDLAGKALLIARRVGDQRLEVRALTSQGRACLGLREALRGIEMMEKSIATAREIGDRYGEAIAAWYLGLYFEETGESQRAAGLMKVRVDYEHFIEHTEAEVHAARVEEILAR